MSELRHYVERQGDIDLHVIELPPVFIADAELDEFERLQKRIMTHGTHIRIDCRQVKHMNSTAWGLIITAYTRAKENGGSLKLDASGNTYIRNFLRVTRLDRLGDTEASGLVAPDATSSAVPKPDEPGAAGE